jgi:hypothetical protein
MKKSHFDVDVLQGRMTSAFDLDAARCALPLLVPTILCLSRYRIIVMPAISSRALSCAPFSRCVSLVSIN